MRTFTVFLSSLTLLAALGGCSSDSKTAYNNLDSPYQELSKQQLLGRWTVINYWASWCKPCLAEMPELNRFHQQISSANTPLAQIFAVNFDDLSADALRIESQKLAVNIPLVVNDPSTTLGFDKPTMLPTTLIFNPQGQLQHTLVGPQTLQSLNQKIGLTGQP